MKKILIAIIILVVIAGAGIAYWLIRPAVVDDEVDEGLEDILPDDTTEEDLAGRRRNDVGSQSDPTVEDEIPNVAPAPSTKILSEGQIMDAGGHDAEGTATLLKIEDKYYLRFGDDFKVENGPDVFVHLGNNDQYDKDANLGKWKGNIGGQNYEIPSDINAEEFSEVWLWCRAFSVPMGKAILETID